MEQVADTIRRLNQRAKLQALELEVVLKPHLPSQADERPIPNKWSFKEQLVHLTRYARHFIHRLETMKEGASQLDRYVENEDATWQKECQLSANIILGNYWKARQLVLSHLHADTNWNLEARHPVMGTLSFLEWIEFFLQHEGHHLYILFKMSKIQMSNNG